MKTRSMLLVGAVLAALVVPALLGSEGTRCVPVEPIADTCVDAADCTMCVFDRAPTSTADCYCRGCPIHPLTRAECDANRDAWQRYCNADVWPGLERCPVLRCMQPPPTACQDGVCVVADETCGDPVARARYADCTAAQDEQSCVDAGGSWEPVGLWPEPVCQCPTGQRDCPCDTPDDCLSACIAPMSGASSSCEDAVGHCSPVSLTVGCLCLFGEDGTAWGVCID